MTVVGLDDTDSRERGMCTTYVATEVASRLSERTGATVERLLLVRLNPAVEHKTRGNAALAVHLGDHECDPETALEIARATLEDLAETADDRTNPGLVVADQAPNEVPDDVSAFALSAIRDHLSIDEATTLADDCGYRRWGAGNGRGQIGALAAIGAWRALEERDWTHEYISYRDPERWGTPRTIDEESVFAAAEAGYPTVWDTVDRIEGETVCVPHTPGPILHGIRGDDPEAVRTVSDAIRSEPVARTQRFVTNQGTDVHLRDGSTLESLSAVRDGRAYRLEGWVTGEPETRRGGHVFFELADPADGASADASSASGNADASNASDNTDASSAEATGTLTCAAFEPTKRFRDRVRALRVGDRLTVCGEVARGTLKLEKFAVRDLVETERVTPTCESCDRRMKSAGRGQGYRCRKCGTTTATKVDRSLERGPEVGWYEVPPCARRHVAKPLIRGGFDGPTHPER
ncbi:tRNA(Ile)(2)-agmatinylcytidine synthase [Natronosalvus rutilus]|uniref:tRNA(Ile2) 2-agmatinylcytidine synthetase TiaS n=1 Tax=Natronosalvus rutilus TaxID=2953753 RepID=A0A9E7NB67_9EURY|nr:tRNA(Ile)(2)-agmatinylcytidine synthase [Natronosalvus rutilus]UTF55082.1 tRNA(Ile)(2)-agmatinylcytidine synthase [Natronosalvus rutilus]